MLGAVAPGVDRTSLDELAARVHPDDRAQVTAALGHAIEVGGSFDVEFRAIAGAGDHWLALRGRLQPGPAGAGDQLIGVIQDVTQRRRLELQLLQSQKMDAIGNLAGGIAHDFNNLLTAIIGNLVFALRALPRDSRVRADVEEAERAARRAAVLTAQLLSYARRQLVVPAPVQLDRTVECSGACCPSTSPSCSNWSRRPGPPGWTRRISSR
ncbi:MAG: PAS domain-containing protein [Gemmatimonadales bacterium]|nr:PAS domain-containing protein [Gemmatimonadales bacterium]